MRVVEFFQIQLIINDAKARFYIISKKLFKSSLTLFDDMNVK